ncbi:anthranilate N-methyltransferase-like [Citrus sinensis]|uniref:anthranilate N-methyltransferase-like n=1 Tax=Citrus sinensis TaxID=2711 RepID=UPI00227974F2|nr:anthranilate N-methyltransferase-like [Citrus sinensis]
MTLDRVLRLLVSYNALHCSFVDGQRLYSLAPVSAYFVRNNQNGASLSPYMALCLDKVCLDGWFGLKKQILEGGIAFNKAHGMQIYDYLGVDSRFNDVFNNGMLSHTSIVMEKVLESYKGFEHVKKLVDVGGGLGTVLLVQLPHGRERTKQEYTELAVKAGFKGVNYDYGVCNLYVMEFFK